MIQPSQTLQRRLGGRRPGAGRPRGIPNKRTRELLARAEAEGILPLDLMLRVMRDHYAAGRFDQAAAVAKDAAPYVHAKLSAVEMSGSQATPLVAPVINVHFIDTAEFSEEKD